MASRRWNTVTKIVISSGLAILAITLVVTFRAMIPSTIVAFLLAFILSYPVNWMQRQTGWARSTAVLAIYILLLAILVLTPALVIPRIIALLASLQQTLEGLVASLQSTSTGFLLTLDGYHLSADDLLQQAGNGLQNVLLATANPFSIFRGVTNGVLQVVYVLVVNFWLLVDLQHLRRWLYEQIPPDYQEDVRRLGEELRETWQAFLRGQIVLAIVVGIITWIPLAIVGMPNAGGLALLSAVMEFLPNVGQGITGTIGVSAAFFQKSTWLPVNNITFTVIVFIIYSIIAQVENVYLVPRLVGGRVKLHPAIAFMGTVAGALVFGVLGVLLAMPVIASTRVILTYVFRKLMDREPFEPERDVQAAVRIRGLIAGRKIEAVILDLDGTLAAPDWTAARWAVSYFYWLERILPAARREQIAQRLMVAMEGLINLALSQLRQLRKQESAKQQSFWSLLNTLRGYPPPAALKPLPAVKDVLPRLASGYRLALISARQRTVIEQFVRCAALDEGVITYMLSGDDVRNLLPNGEGLLAITSALELQPNQLLMVSDTDVNLRAARAMEMATAGVLTGLGRAQEMSEADLVVETIADLEEWL